MTSLSPQRPLHDTFPDARQRLKKPRLTLSLITPIFKNGDPRVPENYRPISLLSIVPKIVVKWLRSSKRKGTFSIVNLAKRKESNFGCPGLCLAYN